MPLQHPEKLTQHLSTLSPAPFEAATTHPFLRLAGQSRLPRPLLYSWLIQDRLYALSYVPFIGSLLSKCEISPDHHRTQTVQWRITDLLIDALTNIRRELGMFEDLLAREFGWGKGGEDSGSAQRDAEGMRLETREYVQLFRDVGGEGTSLLVGLTLLWATEKCYLEAWKYARGSRGTGVQSGEGVNGDVVADVLIPNWTSEEFETFVDRIGGLVDEFADSLGVETGSKQWMECEEIWDRVVKAEERFWPNVEG